MMTEQSIAYATLHPGMEYKRAKQIVKRLTIKQLANVARRTSFHVKSYELACIEELADRVLKMHEAMEPTE